MNSYSHTDTRSSTYEDGVESLKEGQTVDEVETLARVGAEITDNEVHAVSITTNSCVEVTLYGRCR